MKFIKYILISMLLATSLFSNDLKKVNLQLKWKYQFQFAGFIMAKEKGFYKDIGLDVNLKEFNNKSVSDDVLSGKSSYGVKSIGVILDIMKGKELTLIFPSFQSAPLALIAIEGRGINSIEDFKNKRYMTEGVDTINSGLKAMMFSHGVHLEDLILQKPSFHLKDLVDGKTDLIAAYTTNELYILEEMGHKLKIFNPKDYGYDIYSDILIVSDSYLKKNPLEVKAFKKASLKGWEYAYNHIEESVEVILKKYNTLNKSKKALLFEGEELKKIAYLDGKLGVFDELKLEKIGQMYGLLGLTSKKLNFKNIVYPKLKRDGQLHLTNEEIAYLKHKKEINMCIDPDFMPYESFDKDGLHVGMSADFYKMFSNKLGIPINAIKTETWNQSLDFVKNKSKKCDILSLLVETKKRKKYLNFTTPYLDIPLAIATKSDVTYINDVSELKGKKIGIVEGYPYNEVLRKKYSSLKIINVRNMEDGMKKVVDGEIFAYIDAISSVAYMLQTKFIGEIKISGKLDEKLNLSIGVRKDDIVLFGILQKVVDVLDSKEKQNIVNNWISIKVEQVTTFRYIKEFIIFFVVFILFSFFWIRKISKERKKVAETLKNFEFLFNNSIETIGLFIDGKCININEAGIKLFGFKDLDDASGVDTLDFVAPDSIEKVISSIKEASPAPSEVNLLKKDGTVFPVLIKGYDTQMDGKLVRVVAIVDLSAVKEKEYALEIAKDKAESATKSKSEFLANMSHEIRTPMNGILGMSYVTLKTDLTDKQRSHIEKIDKSAKNLLAIINDILDFSKIEAGKLNIEKVEFNIVKMINSVIHNIELKAKEKNIQLKVNYDTDNIENFYGDNIRITQILTNLIGNAVKFTKIGKVEVHVIKIVKGRYRFEVKDTGIGLTQHQQSKLFQSFSQADGSTTRKYGGTGLGLTISKQLVELMNGNIWVESEFDKGSNFIFEIDLEARGIKQEEKVEDSIPKVLHTFKDANILLVEDNKINQEIILGLLEKSGLNIDIANDGQEAVVKYEENPDKYALILMDLQMPVIDGYEATEIIRLLDKEIPIIALTANVMKEDIEKTKKASMNEHLNKPVEVEKLYEVLTKYIK